MFCILASNSPRRQEILRQMGIDFEVFAPNIDESCDGVPAEKLAAALAKKKLKAALSALVAQKKADVSVIGAPQKKIEKADFILAADTIIELDGKVYGKPRNKEQAADFLRAFSGKNHRVITAFAVYVRGNNKTIVKTVKTRVSFAKLGEVQISRYLAANEWQDAAGAYKIQGRGGCLVKRISGSYSCVVGLPVFELYEILIQYLN